MVFSAENLYTQVQQWDELNKNFFQYATTASAKIWKQGQPLLNNLPPVPSVLHKVDFRLDVNVN